MAAESSCLVGLATPSRKAMGMTIYKLRNNWNITSLKINVWQKEHTHHLTIIWKIHICLQSCLTETSENWLTLITHLAWLKKQRMNAFLVLWLHISKTQWHWLYPKIEHCHLTELSHNQIYHLAISSLLATTSAFVTVLVCLQIHVASVRHRAPWSPDCLSEKAASKTFLPSYMYCI